MYAGKSTRGAFILAGAIIIGSLNIIVLPLISTANPVPVPGLTSRTIWSYWIPRIGHDVISVWSIAFWIWGVVDAVSVARKDTSSNMG
jgi:hypothetical protein